MPDTNTTVGTFHDLTGRLDAAVAQKNDQAIEAIRGNLSAFYSRLTADEQRAILESVRQEVSVARIEAERGTFNRSIHAVLDWGHRIIRTTAEHLPHIAEETVRLLVATLGLSLRGIVRGVGKVITKPA